MEVKTYNTVEIEQADKLFRAKILSPFLLHLTNTYTKNRYLSILYDIENVTGKSFLTLDKNDGEMYASILKMRDLKDNSILTMLRYLRSIASYTESVASEALAGTNFEDYESPFRFITSMIKKSNYIEPDRIPSMKQVNVFLKKLDKNGNSLIYLVVSLIIKCGLTSRELTELKHSDILISDDEKPYLKLKNEYGQRLVLLPDDVFSILDTYIDYVGISEDGYILKNKRNRKMSIRVLEKAYKDACNLYSFEYNMYDLRNAAAVCMLAGGATRDEVMDILGITNYWKSKYDKCVSQMYSYSATDMSNIFIKPFNYD